MTTMRFYLGVHHADWLATANVPLFVTRATLASRKTFPRAAAPWALDSGGYTELQRNGRWTISPAVYAAEVRRFRDEVGALEWAAPQDWMCEPIVIRGGTGDDGRKYAGTGLSVEEHQRRTIDNYLELRAIAPDLPWIPVLQGWSIGDYWRHAEDYEAAGVDLRALPLVGIGTVCRRQGTTMASGVLASLAGDGLKLHGFGFKLQGLRASALHLASADSLAWSYNARRNPPIAGHTHKSCANCLEWALDWRTSVIESTSSELSRP